MKRRFCWVFPTLFIPFSTLGSHNPICLTCKSFPLLLYKPGTSLHLSGMKLNPPSLFSHRWAFSMPENPIKPCSVIRIAMFSPEVNTKDKESLGSDVNSPWRKQNQSDLWLFLCAGWWARCQPLLWQHWGHDWFPAVALDQDLLAGVHPGYVPGKCNCDIMTCHSGSPNSQ